MQSHPRYLEPPLSFGERGEQGIVVATAGFVGRLPAARSTGNRGAFTVARAGLNVDHGSGWLVLKHVDLSEKEKGDNYLQKCSAAFINWAGRICAPESGPLHARLNFIFFAPYATSRVFGLRSVYRQAPQPRSRLLSAPAAPPRWAYHRRLQKA